MHNMKEKSVFFFHFLLWGYVSSIGGGALSPEFIAQSNDMKLVIQKRSGREKLFRKRWQSLAALRMSVHVQWEETKRFFFVHCFTLTVCSYHWISCKKWRIYFSIKSYETCHLYMIGWRISLSLIWTMLQDDICINWNSVEWEPEYSDS